jgi:hypothetical protein
MARKDVPMTEQNDGKHDRDTKSVHRQRDVAVHDQTRILRAGAQFIGISSQLVLVAVL